MESNEQIKQINKIQTDTEILRIDWQLSEGRGVGLGEEGERIKKKKTIDTDNVLVITRGKGDEGGRRG